MFRIVLLLLCTTILTACGGGSDRARPAPPAPPPPTAGCNDAIEFCGTIPGNADPCTDGEYWPLSVTSTQRPFIVHFPRQNNEAKAMEMVNGYYADEWPKFREAVENLDTSPFKDYEELKEE